MVGIINTTKVLGSFLGGIQPPERLVHGALRASDIPVSFFCTTLDFFVSSPIFIPDNKVPELNPYLLTDVKCEVGHPLV